MSERIVDERGREQVPNWYAVAVTTGWEKRVRDRITLLANTDRWKDQLFDVVIPATIEKNAKGKEVEKLQYNQYVYVHMILNNETWHTLNMIDGFRTFLPAENPHPLSQEEMDKIFSMMQTPQSEEEEE